MSIWTALWLLWGAAFAVIEGVALTRDRSEGATLSAHLRHWFRVDTHRGLTAWVVISGALAAVFIVHIATPPGFLS